MRTDPLYVNVSCTNAHIILGQYIFQPVSKHISKCTGYFGCPHQRLQTSTWKHNKNYFSCSSFKVPYILFLFRSIPSSWKYVLSWFTKWKSKSEKSSRKCGRLMIIDSKPTKINVWCHCMAIWATQNILVGKQEEKRPLTKPEHTRECDIKLNLQKGCDYDSWVIWWG